MTQGILHHLTLITYYLANKPEDSDWVVLPSANFNCYFGPPVETAKANGIEPYEYLLLVLSMLPYLGKSPTHEEPEKLMPWHPGTRNIYANE